VGEGERDYIDARRSADRVRGGVGFVPALATFAAAAVLALVVAYWGWQLFGPTPPHIVPSPPTDPVATIVTSHIFGRAADASNETQPAGGDLPADARLLGIIASTSERSYALFHLATGPRLVAEGEEVTQGVRLVSIARDAITVRDASGERRFALRAVTGSATAPATASSTGAGAGTASALAAASRSCAPPPGFQGNVVRLNAELLGGLTSDAGPWRALLAPSESGLVVRDGNGFGTMLGLQAGDRIAQANGIALRVPDDVAAAVIRPLVANQGVRIVGSRAGARHELWLANIACAG
jgi:type II secretion system (T2SS) protein C